MVGHELVTRGWTAIDNHSFQVGGQTRVITINFLSDQADHWVPDTVLMNQEHVPMPTARFIAERFNHSYPASMEEELAKEIVDRLVKLV